MLDGGIDGNDPLVCICMQVPEMAIVAAVRAGCLDTASVRQRTGASSHCGDCADDIDEIILDVTGELNLVEGGR
ncbi:MAG: (2Fe-2S)-binding protein [Pseudonocardiaceae bacterium]